MPSSVDEGKLFFKEWFSIFRPKKILDIGPGNGRYGKIIREMDTTCHINAVEIYKPYIGQYNLTSIYNNIYNQDIREFAKETNDYYESYHSWRHIRTSFKE